MVTQGVHLLADKGLAYSSRGYNNRNNHKEKVRYSYYTSWYTRSSHSRSEKEKSLQGETYRFHSKWNEAGASFNTDPSSDERQMRLNIVKCSN
ncbi:hypothetical protein TNCV_3045131 [Trichonephila clavipes]|nr:hypothetical protein TNCV_3045131 [Trichonephila clavipes]